MTVIAGLVHDGKVYIGGDSAGMSGWDLTVRRDPKVFTVGPYVMGFTTSFRMGQLLQYAFTPPEHHDDVTVDKFMATAFIDAVRSTLAAGGFAKKESDRESGGTFLVGYRGRLFVVSDDYQVGESQDDVLAVGAGDSAAIGSLLTSTDWRDPAARVMKALAVAERCNAAVRGPFTLAVEP